MCISVFGDFCAYLEDAPCSPFRDIVRPRPRSLVEPPQTYKNVHLLQPVGPDVLNDGRIFSSLEEYTSTGDDSLRLVCVPDRANETLRVSYIATSSGDSSLFDIYSRQVSYDNSNMITTGSITPQAIRIPVPSGTT